MDFLLRNATVVNEMESFRANVLISNGLIDKIDKSLTISPTSDCKEIDLSGAVVMPGVIDTHVHFREPGLTHKADIFYESKAAVVGGVTSYVDMPNTVPQTTTRKLHEEKCQLAKNRSFANYAFYIGATNNNIDELKEIDKTVVPGVKLFMGSSTGNMLVDNNSMLDRLFSEVDALIAVHAEDEETIKNNLKYVKECFADNPPTLVHPIVRSEEACFLTSKKAVELAKKHNARLHLLHVSTEKELSLLSNESLENKRITAEACISHLYFDERSYKEKGNFIKCNPSIKTERDKFALRKALCDGVLDVVSTDHAPHTIEEKNKRYYNAPSGIPSIQHSLSMMIQLSKDGFFTIEQIVNWMCHNQARCFNIKNRGFIREGYCADIVCVDLCEQHLKTVDNYYKCKWSPFGQSTVSYVLHTFVNGNHVYDGDNVITAPLGEPIVFGK